MKILSICLMACIALAPAGPTWAKSPVPRPHAAAAKSSANQANHGGATKGDTAPASH